MPKSMPASSFKLNPVEDVKSITYVLNKPAQAPVRDASRRVSPTHLKLIVVMSDDRFVSLRHRSKLKTLETLNEENVVWVDGKTLSSLNVKGNHKARLVLSSGKEYPVILREMEIYPEESKYVILPLKLRKRLDINKGAMVDIKA